VGWKHFSIEKREIIQRLLKLKKSFREMAAILGCSPAGVYNEIKRNSENSLYCAIKASDNYKRRRKRSGVKKRRIPLKLYLYVKEKLESYWSPEQVSCRLPIDFPDDREMRISFKDIYRRIARGTKNKTSWGKFFPFLRHKKNGKTLKKLNNRLRCKIDNLPSIDLRPSVVAQKRRFGDWESDLICGSKKQGGYVATLVERTSNFLLAFSLENREASSYKNKVLKLLSPASSGLFLKTITVDRGTEFYGYDEIERQTGVKFYFCHPHSPHERGLNEQINGLLRQFFPKKTSLLNKDEELKKAVDLLNNRPRKTLNFKTPVEVVTELGFQQLFTFT